MPKKILYESAIHQFLWAGRRLREDLAATDPAAASRLADWINALTIENPGPGGVRLAWPAPQPGEHRLELKSAKFYTRGDAAAFTQKQTAAFANMVAKYPTNATTTKYLLLSISANEWLN